MKMSFLQYQNWSLATKVQMFLLGTMLLMFAIIAWQTVSNVKKEYSKYHEKRLERKAKTITRSIEYLCFDQRNGIDVNWQESVKRISRINRLDFFIFDKFKTVIGSSLEDSLVDFTIYENAGDELFETGNHIYSSPSEGLGLFVSINVVHIGEDPMIIQVPYFNTSKSLEEEIRSLIFQLINIYLLFLIIISIVGPLIIHRILRPLNLVRQSMNNLQLTGDNQKIAVNSDDELGRLVQQYNKLIDELIYKAQQLKDQERESAWKDMAKQVAHEIKNPLTPMKLSIQHLNRISASEDSERYESMVKRVSATLIEQIDHLAHIAQEFSSFAKIPEAEMKPVNVISILRSIIEMYQYDGKIRLEQHIPDQEVFASIDKNQFNRVINNILTNSVQAIDQEEGLIKVSLEIGEDITIVIQDNGPGMEDDVSAKVFVPNFSTKSSGMGIGLPMSKRIVENFGGQINFETKVGVGTTFSISLPII